MIWLRRVASTALVVPMGVSTPLHAQVKWQPVNDEAKELMNAVSWENIPNENFPHEKRLWEPLSPEEIQLEPEKLVWTNHKSKSNNAVAIDQSGGTAASHEQKQGQTNQIQTKETGFRWPNGQLMSESDQIYYRTAYSRGSMIQIGETVYPNLGFNALQRHPRSWISTSISAIDDSRIGRPDCETGNFLQTCTDGLMEGRLRLWNSKEFSFDLHWTMHSLSGEGAPFNFTFGNQDVGSNDVGTKFGEGQSLGFVASKNLGQTFGLTFAGYRLFHLDQVTDLPRNFAAFGTKVFRLNDELEPSILSISLGLMTDVYNIDTNIGTVVYPNFLRGGQFRSGAGDLFGGRQNNGYYNDVAGVSSAFVCADQTVFAPYLGKKAKRFREADPNCVKEVYLGPIASIGYAPWPWLGIYTKYGGTDLDIGVSFKPFKNIPWTISIEALGPIKGINRVIDDSFDAKECRNKVNSNFSDCRTRVGIFTELTF